jgi:hypothetical protein
MSDFQVRLAVLQKLGYTDGDRTVQLKGRGKFVCGVRGSLFCRPCAVIRACK